MLILAYNSKFLNISLPKNEKANFFRQTGIAFF